MCSFPRADGNYIPPYGFSSFSPDDYVFNNKVPQVAKRSISERLDEFKKKAYDFESVRAAKNGTSVKKLRLRDIQKQSLTDINNAFHEHMSEFRKRARQMKEFTDRFPIACQHMKADLLQDSYNVDFSMTSDDAKEVKTHHNKRTVNNNYNLDFSYSKPDEKRQRHHDKRIFDPHDAFKYF
uniref:Uncharacterized protein n=2 Tax=Rhizophagus irregularis TaxID=588596 RepID=U9TUD3_RHIID